MKSIDIRRAKPTDAETLTAIAHAAKRHWHYPEEWITRWLPDLTITAEFIDTNEVYVAIIDDAIVGCCALVVSPGLAEIEHMWIRPEQMGAGVGRRLFEHARTRAKELNITAVELSADPYAEGFYERMGAKRIGDVPAGMQGDAARVLPRMRIQI